MLFKDKLALQGILGSLKPHCNIKIQPQQRNSGI